ncbi:MAG: preprotein translocase subunit YajC [Clostridia bacterium]|nr:preprotein translocase subunit YajC [Clostridia bacterium]
MFLFNLLEGGTTPETQPAGNNWIMYVIIGVIIVAFIVMNVISNKKRQKQVQQDQERKDKLCKGTKILTIGGISGVVVSVDHENSTFVLETGTSQIVFDKRAIYQMELPEDAVKVEEKPAETSTEEK